MDKKREDETKNKRNKEAPSGDNLPGIVKIMVLRTCGIVAGTLVILGPSYGFALLSEMLIVILTIAAITLIIYYLLNR